VPWLAWVALKTHSRSPEHDNHMPKHVGVELERINNLKNPLFHGAFVGFLTYESNTVFSGSRPSLYQSAFNTD
jgi:hypothetical protein